MFYTYVGRKGNDIHHIGYKNGKRFHNTSKFQPSIYYETLNEKEIDAYSLDGKPLKQKKFDSINEWNQFYYQNKDLLDLYSDLDPIYQFIARKYSASVEYNQKDIRVWLLDIEVNSTDGFPFPFEAKHPIVSIAIYDSRRNEYIVLGLNDYQFDSKRLELTTNKVTFKKCDNEKDLLQKFIELNAALHPDIWIAHNGEGFDYPYIINRIANVGLKVNDLSPIGRASSKYTERDDKFMTQKSEYYNTIEGISLLDNMHLYKKYIATPRESYSLSNLAIEDLNIDKIDYSEYDNLAGLYEKNYERFIDYNINDVHLMYMLNKKNGYLDIHIRNMYKSKCANFEDNMGPVKMWDIYIYQSLQQKNIQVLPSKKDTSTFSYPGAFVVEPIIAKHKWLVSIDVNSMYPHIQMQWNISPEKLVENYTVTDWLQSLTENELDEYIKKARSPQQKKFLEDVKQLNNFGYAIPQINRDGLDERMLNMLIPTHPDYIMTANGFYFKKDSLGAIPELLIENYNERKHIKSVLMSDLKKQQQIKDTEEIKEQLANYKVAEQGIKIMMNAEYGALANTFFRYCKYELCSAVTMNGQFIDQYLIKEFNRRYPDVLIVAGDTDSLYLSLEKMVEKECKGMSESEIVAWVDKFSANELQQVIDDAFEQIAEYVGATKNYMKMAREKVIISALWTAKKHYAYKMIMEDDKLLSKPKYGYKGLECVKSSIPKAIRQMQKETINTILDDIDVYDMIQKCRAKIMQLSPEEIAFPKTCNGLRKYADGKGGWIKGAQAHVKAAMVYNNYLMKNSLAGEYPMIMDGDKIRFVWLKEPNIFNSPTFGFINRLPIDNLIKDFVDYETIYYKSYEKIMTDMLDRIGLSRQISKTVDLDELF